MHRTPAPRRPSDRPDTIRAHGDRQMRRRHTDTTAGERRHTPATAKKWPPRRAGRITAGLVAAIVAVTGCNGTRPADEVTPSTGAAASSAAPAPTVDSKEQQAREAVLAAYNGYREAYVAAAAAPDPDKTDLPKYVADPLLSQLKFELRRNREDGLVMKGRPRWNPRVTTINVTNRPFNAQVQDCFDNANVDVVDKATGRSVLASGQTTRYVVTAEAVLYDDGRWLIRQATANRERTC